MCAIVSENLKQCFSPVTGAQHEVPHPYAQPGEGQYSRPTVCLNLVTTLSLFQLVRIQYTAVWHFCSQGLIYNDAAALLGGQPRVIRAQKILRKEKH